MAKSVLGVTCVTDMTNLCLKTVLSGAGRILTFFCSVPANRFHSVSREEPLSPGLHLNKNEINFFSFTVKLFHNFKPKT